jgi:hypothetical protein
VVSILRAIQDEPFWQIPSGLSMSKLLNTTQFPYFWDSFLLRNHGF